MGFCLLLVVFFVTYRILPTKFYSNTFNLQYHGYHVINGKMG